MNVEVLAFAYLLVQDLNPDDGCHIYPHGLSSVARLVTELLVLVVEELASSSTAVSEHTSSRTQLLPQLKNHISQHESAVSCKYASCNVGWLQNSGKSGLVLTQNEKMRVFVVNS